MTIDLMALDITSLKVMTEAGVTAIDLMSAGVTSLGLLFAALIVSRQFYVERYGRELPFSRGSGSRKRASTLRPPQSIVLR